MFPFYVKIAELESIYRGRLQLEKDERIRMLECAEQEYQANIAGE